MRDETYLLLFTFGPVQGFISRSRKLRDLFNASNLLSQLASEVVTNMKAKGFMIINPYVDQDLAYPLPNRILAKKESTDAKDVLKKVEVIEEELRRYFNMVSKSVYDKVAKNANRQHREKWENQVAGHLEINWVIRQQKDGFAETYSQINQDLAGVKNEKQTSQLIEKGRKCRLESDKNALVYRGKEKPHFLDKSAIKVGYQEINPGEGLSAVGTIKRFYSREGFDSTASFALRHLKAGLKDTDELTSFQNLLRGTGADDQLYYSENQNERYLQKQGVENIQLDELKKAFYKLKAKATANNLHFHNHYAVLVFDGDDAGKWLSGDIGIDISNLEAYQAFVSKKLGKFAESVKQKVDKDWQGVTIFAGGDDFIGLLHLEDLFDTLQNIRELFEQQVNTPMKTEYQTTKNFTISAGVVVAHYSEPLGRVVGFARSLEQKSKEFKVTNLNTKNAITIGAATRSAHGLTTDITCSWNNLPGVIELFPYFQRRLNRLDTSLPSLISNNLLTQLMGSIRNYQLDENTTNEVQARHLEVLIKPALGHFIAQAYNGSSSQKAYVTSRVTVLTNELLQTLTMGEYIRLVQLYEVLSRHTCPVRFQLNSQTELVKHEQ